MNFYIPKHFAAHEIVDSKTYAKFGTQAFQFMDARILYTADRIRERYSSAVYINTYLLKTQIGYFNFCGYRPRSCTIGAVHSEHRHGRALDLHILNIDAETIRKDILSDPFHEDFKYITTIEAGVNWLHIDCRNIDKEQNGILIVYPNKWSK